MAPVGQCLLAPVAPVGHPALAGYLAGAKNGSNVIGIQIGEPYGKLRGVFQVDPQEKGEIVYPTIPCFNFYHQVVWAELNHLFLATGH
jgi:hypothetical protein